MRRSMSWLVLTLVAGLGASLAGCGSKDEAPTDAGAPEDFTVASAAPAPAQAPAAAQAPLLAPEVPESASPEAATAPPEAEAPVAAAPASSINPARQKDAAATDDLLKLAKNSPLVSAASAPAAGSGPGPGGSSGYPGMSSGGPGMSSGYPGMSSGGPAGSSGYPGMQANPGGPSNEEAMRAAYGQGPGVVGPAGSSGAPGVEGPSGYPGADSTGGPGMAGYPGGSGGAGGGKKEADFSNPYKGAETFLDAVQSKDPNRLALAVALRSAREATADHRDIFQAILEYRLDSDTMDALAEAFEGMKIAGANQVKSTGLLGIILSKTEGRDQVRRTLYVRREKAGWKVLDFTGALSFTPGRIGNSTKGNR